MSYTWAGNSASGNAYRLRPVDALGGGVPNFVAANERPAATPDVGGSLKVIGMNLLNFFNTFGVNGFTNGPGGPATDCRGADDPGEFARQWPKTLAAVWHGRQRDRDRRDRQRRLRPDQRDPVPRRPAEQATALARTPSSTPTRAPVS